jgi:single-stranded DNA-binding protein
MRSADLVGISRRKGFKARALAGLVNGAEVYVEGRLSLNMWTGKDDQQRTGLSVSAWQVIPLGQIGTRKPKV